MHEDSTTENKLVYLYSSNQKTVETKAGKFRNLYDSLKPNEVKAAELALLYNKTSTVDGLKSNKYLQERAKVTQYLSEYYSNENAAENNREINLLPSRKLKLSSSINRWQSYK